MLLLLYLLRNTNYFRYVIFLVLIIILCKLLTNKHNNDNKEKFTGFKCKKERHAYCDTIERVGKFCKTNKSQICREYNSAFSKTKNCLNKILLQADGSSFHGPATSNKKPKL
tara:strand:- start:10508 stop:10843 length:336 start_codon:yes stop_codon:yes gene_type:complete